MLTLSVMFSTRVYLLILLSSFIYFTSGFRVLDNSGHVNQDNRNFFYGDNASYFKPYLSSFVGSYGDPHTFQRERVNEGAFESADQELLFEAQSPRSV